jgi:uncharacterized BrkB/YihY/UPF0761 family membrane protein
VARTDDVRATAKRITDRDSEIGGGLMARSLAYEIFAWMLPFALVVVGGIGIAATTLGSSEGTAKTIGLRDLVAKSVADAAHGSSWWYALLIGIPFLLFTTRSLLKTLVVAHRLVWGDLRLTVPKPTLWATLRFLGLLAGFFVIRELARGVGSWSGSFSLSVLVGLLAIFAWWLVISIRLPHRDARWRDLVPGAIIMALGLELISNVGVYLISGQAESSQRTYGVLGVAATLLIGLYLVGRLVVTSAVVNAMIWERRSLVAGNPETSPLC